MNRLLKKIALFVAVSAVAFSFIGTPMARAQNFNLYSEKDIIVETYPKIPGPNETVKVHLKSYSFNLNNYYIVWYVNGKKESADYGNRTITFRTGNIGVATNVTAVVEFENQVFRKELRFVPAEVDLLWEAIDAYTPPFYKGKALPMQEARVRVTAIPETQLIAPADASKLIYYWDKNYKRIIPKSGFGKNSFEFTADPLLESDMIQVTTNDRRENSFAENSLNLNTKQTKGKILFYEIDSRDRVLTNKALNNNTLFSGDEVKFGFYPLNISSTEPNFTDLFVGWTLNGEDRAPQDFAKQNQMHITTDGQAGIIKIGLKLEGIKKLLQTISENIEFSFQAQKEKDE